jgi:nucleotide-binding universal stress UspA family protein
MNAKNQTQGEPPRISRILVATDFSDQASKALEWARTFAGALGAKLVLLHVINIFSLAETGCVMAGVDPLHLVREQARRYMDEVKRLVPDAEVLIREASPRPAIVDAALELDSGLAHLLLGSVAEYVVRNSKVPVLTVRVR